MKKKLKRAVLVPKKDHARQLHQNADRIGSEAEALDRLVEARQQYNPLKERLAWEMVRHVIAWFLGGVVSLLLGTVMGLIEAIGSALAGAVERQPIVVAPALLVFLVVLAVQTVAADHLTMTEVGQFVGRALWISLIIALAMSIIQGLVSRYVVRTDEDDPFIEG